MRHRKAKSGSEPKYKGKEKMPSRDKEKGKEEKDSLDPLMMVGGGGGGGHKKARSFSGFLEKCFNKVSHHQGSKKTEV